MMKDCTAVTAVQSFSFFRQHRTEPAVQMRRRAVRRALYARVKREYERVRPALEEAEATGYGIIMPEAEELTLEEPEMIRQGGRYGVRLRASAPSLHIMKAGIQTTVSPIVGSEKQSEELVLL